jgi:ABC-2 type transport system ATP-binding protein
VDLDVERGELLALLGPNGAGKTTLVEIIEGYRQADGGSIRVLGQDPWRAGPGLRARLGVMLQEGGVDPRVTPLEALRLYAAFYRSPRDSVEILRLTGLEPVARTRYRRLSGGEKQRLALGLALVGRPDLLLLDEPTAGMDPAARGQTRALIRALRRSGATILLTTHDLGDVERLADRVAILDHGRIVALGSPAELTGGTQPALRIRLREAPGPDRLAALQRRIALDRPGAALVAEPASSVAFRLLGTDPDPEVIALLAAACAAEQLSITELRAGAGSLEERYLELTGDVGVERPGGEGPIVDRPDAGAAGRGSSPITGAA